MRLWHPSNLVHIPFEPAHTLHLVLKLPISPVRSVCAGMCSFIYFSFFWLTLPVWGTHRCVEAAASGPGWRIEPAAGSVSNALATLSYSVDYTIVGEVWEPDLLSTPDNQNKELVKIFLGPDPVTGDQQYDIHSRHAQLYTNRKSLEKFRCSHYATRLREVARAAGRIKGGVILGKRQLVEARCRCIKRRKPS